MYERSHRVRLDYDRPEGRELLDLLNRVPNSAKADANNILKISDREGHQIIWNPAPDDAGRFTLNAAPNGRQWDYVKQALDTSIERERNPVTGQLTTLGGAIQGLKSEMLSKLDALNPVYKAARQTFAGHSEMYDALRQGAEAFKPGTSPEAIEKAVSGMSRGEAEMYRLGAANALRDKLANTPDGMDKVRAAYGSPALRWKIAALAKDPESRAAFNTFLRNEGAMFATRAKATGGSPTAERLEEGADTGNMIASGLRLVKDAAHGNIGAILAETARHLAKVNPELRGQVLNEARKIILNPDPTAVHAFMQRVGEAEMKDGTRQRVISTITRGLPRAITTGAVGP